jgi:hypothetical protein
MGESEGYEIEDFCRYDFDADWPRVLEFNRRWRFERSWLA